VGAGVADAGLCVAVPAGKLVAVTICTIAVGVTSSVCSALLNEHALNTTNPASARNKMPFIVCPFLHFQTQPFHRNKYHETFRKKVNILPTVWIPKMIQSMLRCLHEHNNVCSINSGDLCFSAI
jgi:hypothetical protein